ncbi:hypothetical protein ACWEPH_06535 [Nocardia beijingensis]
MASTTGYATARAFDAPSHLVGGYAIVNVLAPELSPRGGQYRRRRGPRAVSMSSPRTLWIKPWWIEPTGDSQCGVDRQFWRNGFPRRLCGQRLDDRQESVSATPAKGNAY